MDGVQKLVKNELKESLKQLGFKTRKFNFYRQVNGVVQGFKIYAYGHYTIRYNMFPLAWGREYNNYVFEGNEIATLTVPKRKTFLEVIPYGENATEEDMIIAWSNRYDTYGNFAEQLVKEVNDFLLPYFYENSTPCKNLELYKSNPLGQKRIPLMWCLQDRNYKEAYGYLIESINEVLTWDKNDFILNELNELKAMFDNKDFESIEKYIDSKEKITLKSFSLK